MNQAVNLSNGELMPAYVDPFLCSDKVDVLLSSMVEALAPLSHVVKKNAKNPHLKNDYADLDACLEKVIASLKRNPIHD